MILQMRYDGKRGKLLAVRVTETEREELTAIAEQLDMSVSDLTRTAINQYLSEIKTEVQQYTQDMKNGQG